MAGSYAFADHLPAYCEELAPDERRPYTLIEGQEYCEGFFIEDTSTSRADLYLLGYTLGPLDFDKSADSFVRLSVPSVDQIGGAMARFSVRMIGSFPLYRLDGRVGSGNVRWDLTRYVIPSNEITVEDMVLRAWDPRSGKRPALLPVLAEPESDLGQRPGPPTLTLKSSVDLAELCWWIQFDGDTEPEERPRVKGLRSFRPQARIGLQRDRPITVKLPDDRAGWATVSFRTVKPGKTDCSRRVWPFRVHVPSLPAS